MSEGRRRQWHRLFGIGLTDLFADSGWRVELEKELALTSQLLDVVIIEQDPAALMRTIELPDGLENLRTHNLLTYKSQHEALDAWALDELIGHYVNYRKLTGAAAADQTDADTTPERAWNLPPEADFQLFAVATREPRALCRLTECRLTQFPGVFNLRWGLHDIRLIVLGGITEHPRNAPWELFSADIERIRHGARHYRPHRAGAEALLYELYLRYKLEFPNMSYTMADFIRESREHLLHDLPPEERQALLELMSSEERLRGLPPEERLRGLPPEERLRGLSAEQRRRLKELLDQSED